MSDVQLFEITNNPELLIERAARTCYRSNYKVCQGSAERIIKACIKMGHESVLEHASAAFLINCSRACSHQLVRHRMASYSQESQRYINFEDFNYYEPEMTGEQATSYDAFMKVCRDYYKALVRSGMNPEDARYILPNACMSEIVVTMNFRELRHFFKLRCDDHAQKEIRDIAKCMLKAMMFNAPSVFEDLSHYVND